MGTASRRRNNRKKRHSNKQVLANPGKQVKRSHKFKGNAKHKTVLHAAKKSSKHFDNPPWRTEKEIE